MVIRIYDKTQNGIDEIIKSHVKGVCDQLAKMPYDTHSTSIGLVDLSIEKVYLNLPQNDYYFKVVATGSNVKIEVIRA